MASEWNWRRRRRRTGTALRAASVVLGLLPAIAGRGAAVGVPAEPLFIDGDPVRSVAMPLGGGSLYAVGDAALYRSDDGGLAWQPVGPPPPVTPIVVGGGVPDVLLAGDDPPCARGGPQPSLFRSADGGATWEEVVGIQGVRPVGVWPDRGQALATACSFLWVSLDAGATWVQVLFHTARDITAFATVAEPWRDDGVVAEAFAVVTSEGGSSSLLPVDLADPATPRVAPAVRGFWGLGAVAFDGDRLVLGTASGVWVSDDAGATWTGGRTGLEEVTISVDPNLERIPEAEARRGFGVYAVAIDPADPNRLFAGTVGGLFASGDGGATWEGVPGVEQKVVALTLPISTGRLFAETETGAVVVDIDRNP